jgi:hypothetical protein
MPGGRYDRTRVYRNAYKGVLPVLIETRRKGDWVTHVDADESSPNMLSLQGLRQGPGSTYNIMTSCQYRR